MKLGSKALLLPAGLALGFVFEAFALSFSAALPTTGCLPNDATDGGTTTIGPQSAICCGGRDGNCSSQAQCCSETNGACTYDYECCSGSCASGACAAPLNPSCRAALGSRCNDGECQCATADDCCIGTCTTASVGGQSSEAGASMRCCLTTGLPCGANSDCCGGTCRADTLQCQ